MPAMMLWQVHEPGEKLEVKRMRLCCESNDAPPIPVGRMKLSRFQRRSGETVEYRMQNALKRDIKDENYYGTPMSVVVYRNADAFGSERTGRKKQNLD